MTDIITIILISVIAGLGTFLGGIIVVIRKPGRRTAGLFIGFSSGVMLTVAFMGMLLEAWNSVGAIGAALGFGVGALFMFAIDNILPHTRFAKKEGGIENKMLAAGTMLALGIAIHNLPEGLAVGAGFLYAPSFGLVMAIAIALHNIPEGIATALPLYLGGKSKLKALKYSFFSGMAEPLGAIFAIVFLSGYISIIPYALAFAGGVMFFITLDELLPCAQATCHEHATSLGMILGAVIMLIIMGSFGV